MNLQLTQLDIASLSAFASFIAILLGMLLAGFWYVQRIAALGLWACAYTLGGLATAAGLWANASGYVLIALFCQVAGFVACGLVWAAARYFHGRDASAAEIAAGGGIWLAAFAILPGGMKLDVAFVLGALIIAAYATLVVGELWRERRRALRRRWIVFAIPSLYGFVLMMPVLIGGAMRLHNDADSIGPVWMAAFAVELVLHAIATVFFIFMIVTERILLVHKEAALTDSLTGLFNRRGFAEAGVRLVAREEASRGFVTIMICDLDHFKSVNDQYGHLAGDEVLRLFAKTMRANLRAGDLVARVGGEEFAVALACSMEEAILAASRVREAYEFSGIAIDGRPISTTVSIGLAGGEAGIPIEALIAAADAALYRAKRLGRNRIEIATLDSIAMSKTPVGYSGNESARQAGPVVSMKEIV